ncbi:DUF1127 domain-containing protein [Bradyrhizobium diazoefficiens]|nr:DUF1127 domain-containing protein [Bradyrhizobium diazoefficiens]MBR0779664.1 DUF1127 domain-containing protein [Bradyrhizobium diazoefficiens]
MRTISHTPWQGHHLPTLELWSLLARCRAALRRRRERNRIRMELQALSDCELRDFGMTRGEIEYVAAKCSGDIRSGPGAAWP